MPIIGGTNMIVNSENKEGQEILKLIEKYYSLPPDSKEQQKVFKKLIKDLQTYLLK